MPEINQSWVLAATGLLFVLAIVVREFFSLRERKARYKAFEMLREALEATMREVKRSRVDIYVLKKMLHQRGMFSAKEFQKNRDQFLEELKQAAAEGSHRNTIEDSAPLEDEPSHSLH